MAWRGSVPGAALRRDGCARAADESHHAGGPGFTRAWFRRRLDADPRRWVLLLAALEGLAAFIVNLASRPELFAQAPGATVALGIAVLTPALGVMGLLAHGRLLWWTGKALGGRARPHEIHAAFAWSELPFLVAALPLLVWFVLRVVAVEQEPVSRSSLAVLRLLDAASAPLVFASGAAALGGGLLYVRFLAEAQGFGVARAIANHLLAGLLGIALLLTGVLLASRLLSGRFLVAPVGTAIAVASGLGCEALVRSRASSVARAAPRPHSRP